MNILKSIAAATFLSVLAVQAAQAETVLKCVPADPEAAGGWIAPEIFVLHDPATGEAAVFDGLIKHYVGDPIAAKVETDNKQRTTFTWKLKTQDPSGNNSTMLYRLTVQKATMAASFVAVPQGYANTFQTQGKCAPQKG